MSSRPFGIKIVALGCLLVAILLFLPIGSAIREAD